MRPRTLITLCCLFGWLTPMAPAAVLYVNQGAAGATHDGASWATAFLKVQDAINAAHDGDEVWVAKGTYTEKLTAEPSVSLYGGFTGVETSRGQRDWKANPTVLAATGPSDTVVTNYAINLVLDGFTVRDGKIGLSAPSSGSVSASNNTFLHNGTGLSTGDAVVTAFRNLFTGGTLGVYVGGATTVLGSNVITENQTGILNGATATVLGNTIVGNNYGVIDGGSLILANNIVAFNGDFGLNAIAAFISHNDIFGNGQTNYLAINDQTGLRGNISQDPKLSSIYHDIHIEPDSPCRNGGDGELVMGVLDVDGQPRIMDGAVDIGADESDGTVYTVPSRTWYVSTAGSDTNDGSSWTHAKRTIGAALLAAQGGDEVWVAQGTYPESVSIPAGVAVYGGFAGTETVRDQRDITANPTIVDGAGTANPVVTLGFTGGVLDGFTVRNGGAAGVHMEAGTTLSHDHLAGNERGAAIQGPAVVLGNDFNGNKTFGFTLNGPGQITGNSVVNTGGDGLSITNSTATVSRNFIANNTGAGISVNNNSSLTLASNVVVASGSYGIVVGPSCTAMVNNNTLEGNTGGVLYNGDAIVRVANNVIAFSTGIGITQTPNTGGLAVLSHNDIYGNTPNYGAVDSSKDLNPPQDPLFVNTRPLFRDLHLKAGSPCIDAGDDSAVTPGDLDFDGHPRIIGAHVDIGAYEYAPAGLTTLADVLSALRIAGGISGSSPADLSSLNVVDPGTALISLEDGVRLARKVAGLEANP